MRYTNQEVQNEVFVVALITGVDCNWTGIRFNICTQLSFPVNHSTLPQHEIAECYNCWHRVWSVLCHLKSKLICCKAHCNEREKETAEAAVRATVSQETKGKRFFYTLSGTAVLQGSSRFISLLVIGSQALLFGIDLRWHVIELKQFSDTAENENTIWLTDAMTGSDKQKMKMMWRH